MPRRNIQPVSVAGIEFPAMLDETQTFTSDIPEYPVETGFVISDNITLQPMELPLTLLLSDTPLTWRGRVRSMSEAESMLKELYFSKTPFTVVTPSGTFESMGITSMQIKRSSENGYNKEVSLSLKQINVTATKTASIPDSYGKSGRPAPTPGPQAPARALHRPAVDHLAAAPVAPVAPAAPAPGSRAPGPSSTTWRPPLA